MTATVVEPPAQAEPPAGPPSHPPTVRLPVARVAVDVPLSHLDRPFDYAVPPGLDDVASPGCRVKVRFAGRVVGGFVLERLAGTAFQGELAELRRVVSPEPVLAAEVAGLARAVADRYAGTLADVLRLAVPPRQARVEAASSPEPLPPPAPPEPGTWSDYPAGPSFLQSLAGGGEPRAVWTALPGPSWPEQLAMAVQATLASGRGALVVVPDSRDLARVDAACAGALGTGRHVALSADLGEAERYRRWLRVRRGVVRAVVGTRAAMFAPVRDLGLVALWDDGDDLHAEPHAPYPHAREVLSLRAHREGAGLLIGGFAQTAEGAALADGWARPLLPARPAVTAAAPRVVVAGEQGQQERDAAARSARLPSIAWTAAREALAAGAPVLVQVPRRGYQPALACSRCRAAARCGTCAGPIGRAGPGLDAGPACRWCGRSAAGWRCSECDGTALRAVVTGSGRTAQELGRAFPGVPVLTSGRDEVLATVPAEPALVVATPGAEPVAAGGYGAVLLLDGWALLTRPDLRAAEETLRRWLGAAALARPAGAGGTVVVMADPGVRAVQALVGWRPAWFAERELGERRELGFPPAQRWASVEGTPEAVADLLSRTHLPPGPPPLGPVALPATAGPPPASDAAAPVRARALVRRPPAAGLALARSLAAAQAARTAAKALDTTRIQLDPAQLL